MGIMDILLGMFSSGGSKADFAGHDPDDVDLYWRMDHEIDQAEREGDPALQATLGKFGFKDLDHWERVGDSYRERHVDNPDFTCAATRVNTEIQMAGIQDTYELPAQYSEPIEGISLADLAVITARQDSLTGRMAEINAMLAEYSLDPEKFQRVQTGWQGRMSNGPGVDPFAANILAGQWHAHIMQARASYHS